MATKEHARRALAMTPGGSAEELAVRILPARKVRTIPIPPPRGVGVMCELRALGISSICTRRA